MSTGTKRQPRLTSKTLSTEQGSCPKVFGINIPGPCRLYRDFLLVGHPNALQGSGSTSVPRPTHPLSIWQPRVRVRCPEPQLFEQVLQGPQDSQMGHICSLQGEVSLSIGQVGGPSAQAVFDRVFIPPAQVFEHSDQGDNGITGGHAFYVKKNEK